ncbi:hypothetical protein RB598_005233 [Gaeumannomyces tritici]
MVGTMKESIPSLPPPASATLHPPPSPGTHRALRKLQSAHNLGAKASNLGSTPTLTSQQRLHPRPVSPFRRNVSNGSHRGLSDNTGTSATSTSNPGSSNATTAGTAPAAANNNGGGGVNTGTGRTPQRTRGRANSDAPVLQQTPGGTIIAPRSRRAPLTRRSAAADQLSLERLLPTGPLDGDLAGSIESMRYSILNDGIKSNSEGMSQLRIYLWLIMLDCPVLETDAYLDLIHRGASPAYSKIRNDTFRTLTTDPLFRRRVSEASLIRLLNAVAWKLHDGREEDRVRQSAGRQSLPHLGDSPTRAGGGGGVISSNSSISGSNPRGGSSNNGLSVSASSPAAKNRARALTLTTEGSDCSVAPESGTYVQGMNVLAAPFLYAARSESEAFVAFHQLLTKELPGYIRGAMDGVHKGLRLVDKVLSIVDEKLSRYLTSKGLTAEIYAFPSVLTLSACTPPLPEVLQLWDFLFAYGPHLNILCIVAQLMLIRSQIMASPSPNKLLRSFPALQAEQIKRLTLFIAKNIPDHVYAEIINHAR